MIHVFFREIPFAWAQLARYNSIISPERYPRVYRWWKKKRGDKIILLHDCVHVPIFPFHFLPFKWAFLDLLRAQEVEPAVYPSKSRQTTSPALFPAFGKGIAPLLPPASRCFSRAKAMNSLKSREMAIVVSATDQNMKLFRQGF